MKLNYNDFIEDWNIKFPILKRYSQTALFIKAGAVMVGLKLERGPSYMDDYAVFLEIVPLWQEGEKFSTLPMFSQILLGAGKTKTCPFYFSNTTHDIYFYKAAACAEQQFGNLLQETISLESIFKFVDKDINYKGFIYNIFSLRKILKLKLAFATFFDNKHMIKDIKSLIIREVNRRQNIRILSANHITTEELLTNIFSEFDDRNKFMEAIEYNVARHKIARLNSARVINIPGLKVSPPTWLDSHIDRFRSKIHYILD